MKKSLYPVLLLVLCFTAAYAVAQSSYPPSGQAPSTDRDQGNRPPWSEQPSMGPNKPSADKSGKAASPAENEALEHQVQQQLATDPALTNVKAEVNGDVVTLTGTVPGKDDRGRAKQLAQSVPGIRKVKEKLSISKTAGTTTTGASAPASQSTTGSAGGATGAAGTTASSSAQSNTGSSGNIAAGTQPSASPSQSTTTEQGAPVGGTTAAQSAVDLKGQIENSLQKEQLTGVIVDVTDDKVELSGTVPTGRQKETARRIAQSYAGNRKVVDNIAITGQGQGANMGNGENAPGVNPSNPVDHNNPVNQSPRTLPSEPTRR